MEKDLIILALLLGGATAIPFVARRLSVPSAILEIVLGIVLFGFGIIRQPSWFGLLKEMGLIYLMFIAGMELDLRSIVKGGKAFSYLFMSLVGFAVMPWLFVRMGMSYYLGITVAMMSAGIALPVLKESALLKTAMGRDTVGTVLTGEFLSISVLTGIDIYERYGVTAEAAVSAIKIVVFFSAAIVLLKLLYLLAWWMPEKVEKVMESEDPVEEGMRAVIFIAFTGALLAFRAGVEPILGSFMAGLAFSHVFKSKGRFEDKINAIGFGFFIPFFFIGVGAHLDVSILTSPGGILFALFLSVMALLCKVTPILISVARGTSKLEAAATTLLLSSPLSLMIVAGTLGLKTGLLDERLFDAIILASIFTGIVYPMLFRMIAGGITPKQPGQFQAA